LTILWPREVLWPQKANFDPAPQSLSGPASVSGLTQTVASSAGIWKATLTNINIYKPEALMAFRAISAMLDGRLGSILVPFWPYEVELGLQPTPEGAVEGGLYNPAPHSDGAFFSDGSGYVGRVIDVKLTTAIVKGATTASIAINVARLIQPGQHFSIGERLYRLKAVSYTDDKEADINFWPPARDAASVGDNLEMDCPVCRMKLATDSEMDVELAQLAFATPTVNFLEDV